MGSHARNTYVVALDLIRVGTKPFPVNLVQGVGLQDKTANNTRARCSLNFNVYLAEHDVPQRCKLWRITRRPDGEGYTIISICWVALWCKTLRLGGKVDVDGFAEGGIRGAVGSQCRVAVGPCLGGRGSNEGGGQSSEGPYSGGAHLGWR